MTESRSRDRVLVAALATLVVAAVVFLRLVALQILQHGTFVARAEQNQEGRVLLPPRRGDLLDRSGELLATDLRTYSVYAVPRLMKNRRLAARQLAQMFDLDTQTLDRKFATHPSFCWVTRMADPGVEERLAKAKIAGVFLQVETRRVDPGGQAVLPVVGRVNMDGSGVEGVEYQFDDLLRGHAGWATVFKDGTGRQIDLPQGSRHQPDHGHGLMLTINNAIQGILMTRLTAAVDSLEAKQATAVIVDPHTGQVLAMGTAGPNAPDASRAPAISDIYEPGSTFKVVAAAATLEEGLAGPGTLYNADNGAHDFGGFVIHDAHPHGVLTLKDAVRVSSNIVAGKLGMALGADRFYEYATAFGFGSMTGIEFPGEAGGRLRTPHTWSGRSLPTLAMGQEVSVTPLQMALAYSVIANGGLWMKPQLVLAELDEHGRLLRRFDPEAVRRVISPRTADTMRDFLLAVVDSGTATKAELSWTQVAGKTGTAQKYDPATGHYAAGKYISSFVGFVPADDPRLVCLVLIDESKKGYYGGDVAAPVFRDIVDDVHRLRDGPLSPRPPVVQVAAGDLKPPPTLVPDVRLLPLARATEKLAAVGLRVRSSGVGPRVVSQDPAPGSPVERGEPVLVTLSKETAPAVPDVIGLTLREALGVLSGHSIPARAMGSGVVCAQEPAPGSHLEAGGVCLLTCKSEATVKLASHVEDSRNGGR